MKKEEEEEVSLVLGLDHFFSWPREGLSTISRSLAFKFFLESLSLASNVVSSTPSLLRIQQIKSKLRAEYENRGSDTGRDVINLQNHGRKKFRNLFTKWKQCWCCSNIAAIAETGSLRKVGKIYRFFIKQVFCVKASG